MEGTGADRSDRAASGGFEVFVEPAEQGDGYGLWVVDPIERHRVRLYTADPVEPRPADEDAFRAPVDVATSVRTRHVTLPEVVSTYVRDADGEMIVEATHDAEESVGPGTYSVELCPSVKLYLRAEGPLTVTSDVVSTRIEFEESQRVLVGARSHHESPATTIQVTDDPRDTMRAVSTFGSALKNTTPERSYPTLRGHPPLIERGDELAIPDGLEPPDTGVRLEIPSAFGSIAVAAPLAYYLGACVVPGREPQLVTDAGFVHDLDSSRGFEREVERVLKQTFLLDCVTRTEGLYRVTLHEREQLLDRVDLDLPRLYDLPLAEQLREYLSIPYDRLADLVPDWKLTTHVLPTPEHVELLPFVTNDLSIVRTASGTEVPGSEVQSTAAESFVRGGAIADGGHDGSFVRSTASRGVADESRSFFRPEPADSLEQVWVGEGAPLGASKATTEAYHNRLDREPVEGDIGITVVCNDPLMAVERDMVKAAYGSREELPFEIDVHYDLSTGDLRSVLEEPTEFLHYVGHIDADGFECSDGKLDARTLETVGTDAFLLNACQSYDQGEALIDGGAAGGIVTLSDVVNSGAVAMGRTLAQLLNEGFPLQSALEVAGEVSPIGEQYVVVGVGNLAIAQPRAGTPNLSRLDRADEQFDITYETYPTSTRGMGTLMKPALSPDGRHYLHSGPLDTFRVSKSRLNWFLGLENFPVIVDGSIHWSFDLDVDEL